MAPRRWWAYALAGLATAAFLAGAAAAVLPSTGGCGDPPDLYCQQDAYRSLRRGIVATWIGATLLLAGAAWVLWHTHRHPPPDPAPRPAPKQPAKPARGDGPTHTPDGRRLVSARRPPPPP